MPRFWDLFFWGLDVRKGWIGAGFVRFGVGFWLGKMRVGGLTCVFAGNFEVFRAREKRGWLRAFDPTHRTVRDGWGTRAFGVGGGGQATAKARTKANAGVLRFGQNDRGCWVGLKREATAKARAKARTKANAGVLRFGQNDKAFGLAEQRAKARATAKEGGCEAISVSRRLRGVLLPPRL